MLARCEQAQPLEIEHITGVLRKQGRDVMADVVEGMGDYISELKIKLAKATKNRPPRKLTYKKPK